nr:immunoglobulin light chain junction region [Macaca mulatta]
CLQYSITPCTF